MNFLMSLLQFGRKQASERSSDDGLERPAASSVAEWVLAVLAVIAFLYFARSVVLPVVMAGVVAMALRPVMVWLTAMHLPRVVSSIVVMLSFVAVVGTILAELEGPAVQWIKRAPQYEDQLQKLPEKLLHPESNLAPEAGEAGDSGPPLQPNQAPSASMQIDYKTILTWTGATLSQTVEMLVMVFLLLNSENLFSTKMAQMLRSRHSKRWVQESMLEIQAQISSYLFSITLINIVLGLAVGLGLALLRFPNAVMWGLMAALLNYIPYFGPILGIIVVGVVSFFTLNSFPREVWPVGWYLVVHILESDVITPIILGRRFTLHPAIIFVALMFWTWIWGIPGALLAVPLLVSAKVICERTPKLSLFCPLLDG